MGTFAAWTGLVASIGMALVACGSTDPHAVSPWLDDGSVARASIESATCGSKATLIELPEHCRWPEASRRTTVLATTASVVVDVDAEGKPRAARVVGDGANAASPCNPELRGAVVACAMQGRYRPAWDGAGETCPVSIRLARYPTDIAAFR